MPHAPTCPICDKPLEGPNPVESPLFPFCSRRCRLVDLNRWTTGRYAVVEDLTPDRFAEELNDQHEGQAD